MDWDADSLARCPLDRRFRRKVVQIGDEEGFCRSQARGQPGMCVVRDNGTAKVRSVDGARIPLVAHRQRGLLRILPLKEGTQISVYTLANPSQGLIDLLIYLFGGYVDKLGGGLGDNVFELS